MSDAEWEARLARFIAAKGLRAEHLVFERPTRSVEEAMAAAGARREDFVKSVCLVGADGTLAVAVVKGEDRTSPEAVGAALGAAPPRLARPSEMLERTGYPAGGTPPFGFEARWLVDERVMEREWVLGGGGSPRALVRISPAELLRANGGRVARVRA